MDIKKALPKFVLNIAQVVLHDVLLHGREGLLPGWLEKPDEKLLHNKFMFTTFQLLNTLLSLKLICKAEYAF